MKCALFCGCIYCRAAASFAMPRLARRPLLVLCVLASASSSRPPTHVQLSPAPDATAMHVQWTTSVLPWPASRNDVLGSGVSTVEFGSALRARSGDGAWAWRSVTGSNWTWQDALSPTNRTYTHHFATMTGLVPGQVYHYRVGAPLDGWSAIASFRASRAPEAVSEDAPLKLLFYGDLGWTNAQALSYLQDEAAAEYLDLLMCTGDYAYDLQNQDGLFGDQYQLSLQPITQTTPWRGVVGNRAYCAGPAGDCCARRAARARHPHASSHLRLLPDEGAAGFQHYLHRFRLFAGDGASSGVTPAELPGLLPNLPNNFWYSFDLAGGLVHVAAISTECYFIQGCPALQAAWLEADLAAAARAPWLIVAGHRSVYCSCDDDCDFAATVVREGVDVNGTRLWGLEPILRRYAVDIYINGCGARAGLLR
jgi:hypothetical protein